MEELVTIKQEPQWIFNNDEYASSELYKDDPNISYTEYEIRPYYENDIDFEDIKCKVGYKYYWFIFIFLYYHHSYWLVYRVWDAAMLLLCGWPYLCPIAQFQPHSFCFSYHQSIQTKKQDKLNWQNALLPHL